MTGMWGQIQVKLNLVRVRGGVRVTGILLYDIFQFLGDWSAGENNVE